MTLGSTQSSTGMNVQCVGLTTLPPSCVDCLEIPWTSTPWKPKGLSRNCSACILYLLQDICFLRQWAFCLLYSVFLIDIYVFLCVSKLETFTSNLCSFITLAMVWIDIISLLSFIYFTNFTYLLYSCLCCVCLLSYHSVLFSLIAKQTHLSHSTSFLLLITANHFHVLTHTYKGRRSTKNMAVESIVLEDRKPGFSVSNLVLQISYIRKVRMAPAVRMWSVGIF